VGDPTLATLVGRQVRQIRVASDRSQDELASAARRAGLDWTRAAVAALETGRRGLSAEELLLLPLALTFLDEKEHTLAELIPDSQRIVRPTGAPAGTKFLRHLARGGDARAAGARERQIAQGVGIKASGERPEVLAYMAAREAEQHAARVLGVSPEDVARAAWRRWRRGLTEERERRVELRSQSDASPGSLRVIRGHVGRDLLDELRGSLEGGENDG
jgi:hypothetical protein